MLLLTYQGIENGTLKTKSEVKKEQSKNIKALGQMFPLVDRRKAKDGRE